MEITREKIISFGAGVAAGAGVTAGVVGILRLRKKLKIKKKNEEMIKAQALAISPEENQK